MCSFFKKIYSLPRTGSQNDTRRQNRRRSRRMYERANCLYEKAKKKLHKAYSDTARAMKSSSSAVRHRLGDGAACRKMCGFQCEFSSTTSCLCRNSIVWNTCETTRLHKKQWSHQISIFSETFLSILFFILSQLFLYTFTNKIKTFSCFTFTFYSYIYASRSRDSQCPVNEQELQSLWNLKSKFELWLTKIYVEV